MIERHGERFLQRVFTCNELAACEGRVDSLAARWAAKEAVAKALGTGIGKVKWRDIEVVHDDLHCPCLRLHGAAAILAEARGLTQWAISLAHDGGLRAGVRGGTVGGRRWTIAAREALLKSAESTSTD